MANVSTTITFLFAGDGSLASEGLSAFLQTKSNYMLVAECQDGASAITSIASLKPQIAVIDAQLPDMSATEIVTQVRAKGSLTKIVVLGASADREEADRFLEAGADAFVVRNGPSRHLTDAIRYIQDDGKYLGPQLTVTQPVGAGKNSVAAGNPFYDEAIAGLRIAVESQGRTVERLEQAMSRAEHAIELLQQKVERIAGAPIEPPPATPPQAGPDNSGETQQGLSARLRAGVGAVAAMLIVGVLGFQLAGILHPKQENVAAEFAGAGAEDSLNSASASTLTTPSWENSMVEQAMSLLRSQRYDAAEKVCRKLLKEDPASLPAKRVLASALYRQDKLAEAADVVSAMSSPVVQPLRRSPVAQKMSFDN